MQCIGGGATNGQTDEGIIIIAGQSCTIAKMNYDGEVLIGIPNDFVEQDANLLMTLEENNLWKFKKTGEKYKDAIAYTFLHQVLPNMTEGKIESLADIVFNYRFNMGSIDNCSFVFPRMNKIASAIRKVYEDKHCEFLALSSVGPAFFSITNNEKDTEYCIKEFERLNMKVIKSKICNHKYIVKNEKEKNTFWQNDETNLVFYNRKPSKYITDIIDKIVDSNKITNSIDIGCGGGRYSKYLSGKVGQVTSIDKNKEMFKYCEKENIENIKFKVGKMDELEEQDEKFDLALSIGVIHNSTNIEEYKKAFEEIYRILKKNGNAVVSVFTDDIITHDLLKGEAEGLYLIKNRPPMILLSKEEIGKIVKKIGFEIVEEVDEHITEVGDDGKRNVWSIWLQK